MGPPVQLRVLVTGIRVKDARPYFLQLQVRTTPPHPTVRRGASKSHPRNAQPDDLIPFPRIPLTQTLRSRDSKPNPVSVGDDLVGLSQAGTAARTETTEVTSAPEFTNRAFVMTVPRDQAGGLVPQGAADLLGGRDWPGNNEGPGVAIGDGPPALLCQLFARKTALNSAMGHDILCGTGYVEFFGPTVQRLQRGEAVSVNVSMESPEGRDPAQVSLQITMLDTNLGGSVGTRDKPTGTGRSLRVSVLVHSAKNLPKDEASGRAPAAFVAAKTMREAAARLPSRAATRALKDETDPIWNEVVTVEVGEKELDREKVLLAVVNHDTNKLMAKAAIPLRALSVGRHYNLSLQLGNGASLDCTVVMPSAPERELKTLEQKSGTTRVEASVMGISGGGDTGAGFAGPVTAVWSLASSASSAKSAGAGKAKVYTSVNAGSEDAVVQALSSIGAEKTTDVVPTLQGSSLSGPSLWPSGHRAAFYCSSSAISHGAAIVLELHNGVGMIGRAVMPTDDLGPGGKPSSLNDVPLVIRGEEVGRVTVTARVWPRDELIQSRKKEVQGGFDPGGGLGLGGNGEGAWMLSAMATDMIDKQAALDDALARLESSERRVENLKFRYQEAEASRQRLEGDNGELRRLLHEERNADPAAGLQALGLNGVDDLMEAKDRLGQLAARYSQEKRRNAELVHRLKAVHEQTVQAEQLKGRHLELQEAHAELSKYLQKCEREAARVGKCRATIEMQEGIIARLEGLLEQSVVDGRRLAEAEAEASRLRDANAMLQSGPDYEELAILRDEVKDLRLAYQERERDHRDLQAERVALTLRSEKAEANGIASNNEMLEVSRRCAREIAGLRAKLAEKDAQLMGGFGSVSNMILQEYGTVGRLTTMEPVQEYHHEEAADPRQVGSRDNLLAVEPRPPSGSPSGVPAGRSSRPGSVGKMSGASPPGSRMGTSSSSAGTSSSSGSGSSRPATGSSGPAPGSRGGSRPATGGSGRVPP